MTISSSFTTPAFFIESAIQYAPATVRVKFTNDPVAVAAGGSQDALTVSQYTLTGPGLVEIQNCGSVVGDPQSIDLFLTAPLVLGQWSVAVSPNVLSVDATSLGYPFQASFTASLSVSVEAVNQGSVNDSAGDVLRKHLNPALKGKGWDSLIAAIATGEQRNWDNARTAFDQLFIISASGSYLQGQASDDGVVRPPNLGMSDDLFRAFAIEYTNDKLTEHSLLKILEIFYGEDSVRASSTSGLSQPYIIADGDTLSILFDESVLVNVTFAVADFAIATSARAIEVAAAIKRACEVAGSNAYAKAFFDPQTASTNVRIYSGSLGLRSSVRILGGSAQTKLNFNTPLNLIDPNHLPHWIVSLDIASGIQRWTPTGSGIDISNLEIGDYVTVYATQFQAVDRGTFTITNVYYGYPSGTLVQYFEISNINGTNETQTQFSVNDVAFYRPTKSTVYSGDARSVIVSQPAEEIDIILPATSQAVGRGPGKAAYNQVNASIPITGMERVRGVVSVIAPGHGLAVGDQIIIDGAYGVPVIPPVIAGDGTALASRSKGSIWATTTSLSTGTYQMPFNGTISELSQGQVLIAGGDHFTAGAQVVSNSTYDFRQVSEIANSDGTYSISFATDVLANLPYNLASLASSVASHLTPLYTDKLVLTGGWNGTTTGAIGAFTYFYDKVANTYSSGPSMYSIHVGHQQTTLANGKVLVSGGMASFNVATTYCEVLDLSTTSPSWTGTYQMKDPRVDHQQVLLSDGRVLAIGGRTLAQGYSTDASTVALYRMGDATCTTSSSLNLTTSGTISFANLGVSGTAVTGTAGSFMSTTAGTPSLPIFNTFNGIKPWTIEFWTKNFPQSNVLEVSSSLGHDGTSDTNVLVGITGTPLSGGMTDSTIVLHLYTEQGSNAGNDMYFVASDFGGAAKFLANTWNHFTITAQASATAGLVDYNIYLNGVLGPTRLAQASASATGSSTYQLNIYKTNKSAGTDAGLYLDELMISNAVRPAPGIYYDYQASSGDFDYANTERLGIILNTCEIYDPATNRWTRTGGMGKTRTFHKAVLLPNDRVLVIGGLGYDPSQGGQPLAVYPIVDAEIWNPITNTWYPAGKTAYQRDSLIAQYLPQRGQVIVAGGSYTTATEIFDVNKQTWSIGSAVLPQLIHKASSSLIGNGEILVLGGYEPNTKISNNMPLLYVPNNDLFMGGSLNGPVAVAAVVDANTFQYITPGQLAYTSVPSGGSLTSFKEAHTAIKGPFLWDPNNGVAVTAVDAVIQTDLNIGHQYVSVTVDNATVFPDTDGWLVFDFGYQNQVGPVRYYGLLSSTQLALDFSFKFTDTVSAGTKVTLLVSKAPYSPSAAVAETVGSLYLTDSSAGRIAASKAIDGAVAAGVVVDKTVVYPGDRGLGGEGLPASGSYKVSDKVSIWGSDDQDADLAAARGDS